MREGLTRRIAERVQSGELPNRLTLSEDRGELRSPVDDAERVWRAQIERLE